MTAYDVTILVVGGLSTLGVIWASHRMWDGEKDEPDGQPKDEFDPLCPTCIRIRSYTGGRIRWCSDPKHRK